ncbi:MAG: (2Fe-2S)-binding protein [Bacteroidetes bacterium]|nr:(2Fe-2S)-binding protein [Bacteroidota bacterium]
MVHITINGRVVQASDGEMLLDVLRREGIYVPALCEHQAVEAFGACRLCTVEITRNDWKGWKNYVTSCLYPVVDGLIVQTDSETVIELRKTLLDLQLARHPNTPLIQKLAADYGVLKTSYEEVPDGDDCILCALCTRICDRMGFAAISTVGRGHGKRVAPPLDEPPPDCIGCLACAQCCPTSFIKFVEDGARREIWGKKFELIECKNCGKPTLTKDFARNLADNRNIPYEYFEVCDDCHRKEIAATMGRITNWSREEEPAS